MYEISTIYAKREKEEKFDAIKFSSALLCFQSILYSLAVKRFEFLDSCNENLLFTKHSPIMWECVLSTLISMPSMIFFPGFFGCCWCFEFVFILEIREWLSSLFSIQPRQGGDENIVSPILFTQPFYDFLIAIFKGWKRLCVSLHYGRV